MRSGDPSSCIAKGIAESVNLTLSKPPGEDVKSANSVTGTRRASVDMVINLLVINTISSIIFVLGSH